MLFVVQFEDIYADHPERIKEREEHMDAHIAFLAAQGNRIVASGALRESEGGLPQGGMWIVSAQNKDDVNALYQEDPFWRAGLRKSVRVSHWAKAVWSSAFAECIETITST
jgi:uncharacterized protein